MSEFISNFPILAIMSLFLGAFVTSLLGRRNAVVRNIIVFISMALALIMMLALIKPVFIEGQVIGYWLGNWAPVADWAIGIGLEVDALSLFFGLIITVAVFVSGTYSFTYMSHDDSLVNYYTLFLMLSGSVLGLVLSGDLFNMFVMIEIMTFTAVALTAFRNTYEGALEGALKYLVVGALGSSSVLIGTALIYSQLHTLNLAQITALLTNDQNIVTGIAFAFLFIGFGTKAFLFPFHPLAADAHAVAPASISLMISGVLTKCGVYGIIRLVYCLYQNIDQPFVQYLVTAFGAVSMFVCVTMAFNQHNFKRLLAFHSISQVGYVITAVGLGTSLGLASGLYHAMNHTIFKGLLFLTAGAVQHMTGSLDLDELGGLSKKMPRTCVLFLIGAASISGLPPFNGFASKWLIYQAAYEKASQSGNIFFLVVCVAALITSVLTLASFVKVAQSVFFGQLNPKFENTKEVPLAMRIPMWILAVLCIVTGVFPGSVADKLLMPAVNAATNTRAYVSTMMGEAYAAAHQVVHAGASDVQLIGVYSPMNWLLLLLSITSAVCLVAVLGAPEKKKLEPVVGANVPNGPMTPGSIPVTSQSLEADERDLITDDLDPKYESFFSGEHAAYSQVGGSDLFWGFKKNWRHYFSFMHEWHSGILNDYALYGACSLALVLLLCVLFL